MRQKHLIIYTDGASRGNPGPASAAYIISDSDGKLIEGRGSFLGETTNNSAEYTALAMALKAAAKHSAESVEILSDSELMVRQITGRYRVKSPELREIYLACMEELKGFNSWKIRHIAREHNSKADELANRAIDSQADVELPTAKNRISRKVRLGVLISGGGRTMVNIQEQIKSGYLNAEIAVVISSRPDVRGVERAREIGLKPVIVRRRDFADLEMFSEHIAETLYGAKVDLVIQAGWLCLWQIPEKYKNRVMNIHPALLPSFGGQGMWGHHVHEAVLGAGCKVSGCTVHFCTNEYDKGPIIIQRTCPVKDDDNADTLAERVFEQECIAYPQAIRLFSEKNLIIQDGIVRSSVR